MAENVKIAEIDIGVDKLVARTGEVKQEIERLRKAQKDLKKDTDNLTAATKEQLEEYTHTEIELKNLNKEYRASNKVLDAYINIQNQEVKTINQARDANLKLMAIKNDLNTENEDHAKMITKINAEVDKNTDFIKANSSEYEKTKINVGNYKESIKEALAESGLFGQEIEGVTQVFQSFAPVFNTVKNDIKEGAQEMRNSTTATEGMTAAQKGMAVATGVTSGALKIFRAAMIATGIGAFVVIVGSLVAYLASTQEGINKVNMVLTPLKEIFGSMLGILQEFGKKIFDAFSNPKKLISDLGTMIKENLINRFTALSKIIESAMNFDWKGVTDGVLQAATGVEDLTGKVSNFGKEIGKTFGEAIERGKEIETIKQNLSKTEAAYITQQAQLRKVFEEQKKLAEDVNKPIAEREAAAAKAIQAQEEISKGTIERIKQEARLLELKQMANDTSDAEKAELARKLAEIDKALEEEAAKTTEAQNKLNSIRKEGAAKQAEIAREAVEKRIQAQQEELDFYLAQQGTKAKTFQEELTIAEEVSKKKLAILDAEYKAGKISKTAYETEKLNITQEFAEMQANAAVAHAEKELEAFKAVHQSRIDNGQFLSDELFNQEVDRLNRILEAEKEFQRTKYEEGLITHEEYLNNLNQLDAENAESQAELKTQQEEDKRAKEAIDLQNKRIAEAEAFQYNLESQMEAYQAGYEQRKAAAMEAGADMTAFERAEAEKRKQIEAEVQGNKMNLASESFQNLASVLGKESAAGKAAAIAATTIDTYQAATAAYKAMAGIPVVGPALGAVAAAAAVASGLKTVKQIIGVKKPNIPKAERGIVMDIGGKRHSQGGTTFYDETGTPVVEAEAGEKMVILKREASAELAALSALNQRYGGVNLSTPVTYANNGGAVLRQPSVIQRTTAQPFDYEQLGSVLAERVNAVQTVIPVKSITNMAARKSKVTTGASE